MSSSNYHSIVNVSPHSQTTNYINVLTQTTKKKCQCPLKTNKKIEITLKFLHYNKNVFINWKKLKLKTKN
jgi:hypothetical protein